jgi:hypothetical protein
MKLLDFKFIKHDENIKKEEREQYRSYVKEKDLVYLAPEVMSDQPISTTKLEVFNLGVILLRYTTGFFFRKAPSDDEVYKRFKDG